MSLNVGMIYLCITLDIPLNVHTITLYFYAGELSIEAAIPGECGDTINLDHNSPTSQFIVTNAYPSGSAAYCNWYINSPTNTAVVVEFYDWQTLDQSDRIWMYDSTGRQIFHLYSYGQWNRAPHSIVSDSSVRIHFDAYNSVSDSSFGVKVSFTDHLQPNDVGVIPSSGGIIELNDNLTSLTIQTMNSTYEDDGNMDSNWFFTGPVGRRLKVQFHQLNAGYLYVYDGSSTSTSKRVSTFRKPSVMPEDRVFSQNSGTLNTHFDRYEEDESLLFSISITGELISL
nr:uncharacterized protein LOC129253631 [Lytechinus pictus]